MENIAPLHAQKVTILSRLIKESSLTLEEALILLKEEEQVKQESAPLYGTTSVSPYWGSTGVNTFTITSTGNVGIGSTTPSSFFTDSTSVSSFSPTLDITSTANTIANLNN
jgi:hypothetical protein